MITLLNSSINAWQLTLSVTRSHLFSIFPSFNGYSIVLNIFTSTNYCPKVVKAFSCKHSSNKERLPHISHVLERHALKQTWYEIFYSLRWYFYTTFLQHFFTMHGTTYRSKYIIMITKLNMSFTTTCDSFLVNPYIPWFTLFKRSLHNGNI